MDNARPIGDGEYVVQEGDCLSSISEATGHFWQVLWDLPANAPVKRARKDPNVLLPGDRLVIPAIEPKSVAVAAGKVHRFRRKGVPAFLRVRFLAGGAPRGGEPFTVVFEASEARGTLDDGGWLSVAVPAGAQGGTIRIGEGPAARTVPFRLGTVDPIDTLRGVQARLRNLGFDCPLDGIDGPSTRAAIAAFQRSQELPEDGQASEAMRAKLRQAHRS